MENYDYIITGGGCAGLSLLVHMIRSGAYEDKKILLIDQAPGTKPDRTWCFWEKTDGLFSQIIFKQWEKVWFHSGSYSALKNLSPYRYKMIRGKDFYQYCHQEIAKSASIRVLEGTVEQITSMEDHAEVSVGDLVYSGRYVFNSILFPRPAQKKSGSFSLLQHFKGWVVETGENVFQPGEATLMDFRVSQQLGTTFVYVMPFSETKALVEFTMFSPSLLERAAYDLGLENYMKESLHCSTYRVLEQEFGIIPMTNEPFPEKEGRVIHIGTAGGMTKPSSGYTFQFIQKQARQLVGSMSRTGVPETRPLKRKFKYYDSVLLNVLATGKLEGQEIFTQLFRRNAVTDLFCFLDNESHLSQDLRIIGSLPKIPFLRAGLQQLL